MNMEDLWLRLALSFQLKQIIHLRNANLRLYKLNFRVNQEIKGRA